VCLHEWWINGGFSWGVSRKSVWDWWVSRKSEIALDDWYVRWKREGQRACWLISYVKKRGTESLLTDQLCEKERKRLLMLCESMVLTRLIVERERNGRMGGICEVCPKTNLNSTVVYWNVQSKHIHIFTPSALTVIIIWSVQMHILSKFYYFFIFLL
jgi:hypothetical protein